MRSVTYEGELLGWFEDSYWGNFAWELLAGETELDSDGLMAASYWAGYRPGVECIVRLTELGIPFGWRPEWFFATGWDEVPNKEGLVVFHAPQYEVESLRLRLRCRTNMLLPEPPGKSRYEMLGESLRCKKLMLAACGGVPAGSEALADLWRKLGE